MKLFPMLLLITLGLIIGCLLAYVLIQRYIAMHTPRQDYACTQPWLEPNPSKCVTEDSNEGN